MSLSPLKFIWKFTVLEGHLDTFAHMNHATYLQLFEQARWQLITERGYGMKKIMDTQIGPTILEAKVQYRRELRLREEVTIETVCREHKGKIATITQRMLNSKNEEAATIDLLIGLFDMKARKLINPTAEWLHALGVHD